MAMFPGQHPAGSQTQPGTLLAQPGLGLGVISRWNLRAERGHQGEDRPGVGGEGRGVCELPPYPSSSSLPPGQQGPGIIYQMVLVYRGLVNGGFFLNRLL